MTFEILVNTSGLAQGPGGLIDMQLSPAYPPGSPSVSALVFNPTTDGTISSGASLSDPATGTAAGDLTTPAGVSMNNTAFSEIGQDFTVASFFDVFVTISGTEIGPGAVGPFSGTVISLTVFDSGSGMESTTFTVNPNIDGNGNPIIDGTIGYSTSDGNVTVIAQSQSPNLPASCCSVWVWGESSRPAAVANGAVMCDPIGFGVTSQPRRGPAPMLLNLNLSFGFGPRGWAAGKAPARGKAQSMKAGSGERGRRIRSHGREPLLERSLALGRRPA